MTFSFEPRLERHLGTAVWRWQRDAEGRRAQLLKPAGHPCTFESLVPGNEDATPLIHYAAPQQTDEGRAERSHTAQITLGRHGDGQLVLDVVVRHEPQFLPISRLAASRCQFM